MRSRSEPPEHVREGLGRALASGLLWKGSTHFLIQVIRFGVALAIARMLGPHDYGLAAMVLLFAGFVLVFSDLALGPALVQRRTLTQTDCSTAFWTSIGAGITFTLIGMGLAGPIAAFFNEAALQPMLVVFSASFLVSAIGTTQSALLLRGMRFRGLQLRELAATSAGAVIAISVALAGGGAWAIVAQQLVAGSAATVLVWRFSTWRPDFAYSLSSLRSVAGFSANVLGMNVLRQIRPTVQGALIGRFLGAPALGAYTLAYNVVLVPFNRVAVPLSQVLFPALSSVQDSPERIRAYWLRSVRMIAALALPATIGVVIVAPDFVRSILGEEWADAVPVIQLLAVVGLVQTLQFLNPIILQALDRTTLLLAWSLASSVAMVTAVAVGLRWGIVGVAAGLAIASSLIEPIYTWLTARVAGVPVREVVRSVAGVAQASLAMAVAVLAARYGALELGLGPGARLGVVVLLGMAVFAAASLWRAPEVAAELRALRRRGTPLAGSYATAPNSRPTS